MERITAKHIWPQLASFASGSGIMLITDQLNSPVVHAKKWLALIASHCDDHNNKRFGANTATKQTANPQQTCQKHRLQVNVPREPKQRKPPSESVKGTLRHRQPTGVTPSVYFILAEEWGSSSQDTQYIVSAALTACVRICSQGMRAY